MNSTYSLEDMNDFLTENAIPNIATTIIYLILGIAGNSFVIYVYTFATRSSIDNKYFILVLAIIDMISCVVNCVFTIVLDTMQVTFTSPIFCKLLRVACHVTALTSAFILMTIALQRYLLVCRPFGKQMTPTWRRNFVIISVVLSCLLGGPAFVFYGPATISPVGYDINGTACKYEEHYIGSSELAIYNVIFMLACVAGIIAISVLYAMVVKKIYEQRKKFPNTRQRGDSTRSVHIQRETSTTDSEMPTDSGIGLNNMDQSLKRNTLDKSLKRNASLTSFAKFRLQSQRKKAKESLKYHRFSLMFIMISLVCVISFMPLRTLEFMEFQNRNFVAENFGKNMPLYRFLYTSYIVNNIMNPLIYGVFDKEFRNHIPKITCK